MNSMRSVLSVTNYMAKIAVLFLAIAITSCNALKRVEVDELLIVKNSILIDSVKTSGETIQNLILQQPNTTLAGYPLRLNLYNLAKVNADSSYHDWLYRKKNRKEKLDKFLSEKQTKRLGESYLVKGLSTSLKEIGEPPAVLDTVLTKNSLERLSAYYIGKGYFNNKTSFTIDTLKRKQRAAVNYHIELGMPFLLDTVYHEIKSKAIDSLFEIHKKDAFVKSGNQFDKDNFLKERERLTEIFRNNGVWNFQESAISFNAIADTTRQGNDQKMDIEMSIDNLKKRDENSVTSKEYQVYSFDKINIYTDFIDNKTDSIQYQDYGNYRIFYKNKLRFKPKTLTNAVFFKKDSIYKDLDRTQTLRQITNLNVFKYPSILFVEDSVVNTLTANIYLTEKKKYSFAPNLEVIRSDVRDIGVGISAALISRNIFGGAENLSISGSASFGLLAGDDLAERSFSEIGADINLSFPRIWLPLFNTDKIVPNYMLPSTNLKLGTFFQRNIGLDKRTFNGILGYSWIPSNFINNSLDLFNVQFVNNLNPGNFFTVYNNAYSQLNTIAQNYIDDPDISNLFDEENNLVLPDNNSSIDGPTDFLVAVSNDSIENISADDTITISNIEERRERLIENNLIFTSSYTFNKNNREGATDNNFYQFRFKIESAGNFLALLSNAITLNENEFGNKEIFDVAYSQYLKTEFDYIKYWNVSQSNVLALHSFAGIAVPYGNSDNIPFLRSYFAGGSNDNRAWRPYSLGPGRTSAVNDFNEANLKLALNLEYRFPIAGNFKGALFVDAGNIWNVFDNIEDPDLTFNGFSSLKDIAIGTGFGVRYDFTYFVLRGDLGFKMYNPADELTKRWFNNFGFGNSVLQIGINYPF